MDWAENTIWWHVYPLGFSGAPVRPTDDERALTHRLRHLSNWLDYSIELGTNGLLLGPIFTATHHGYDTLDYFTIDPRLGDEDDFDALAAACRERGIHLLLDGVFNHVGENHPLFLAALEGGPDSPEAAMFHINWDEGKAANFEGHEALVALNHGSRAVEDLVVDVMRHWLGRGASGWRLDAAYAVDPEFWARVLPRVRAEFPDAWFLGEVIHGDYAQIVIDSSLDSLTQYWLWKATWSSLSDGNFFELDHALGNHNALLDAFVPQTFVGNHDTTRIATQVGDAGAALAAVVLFTVGGIPSVYYGDEQAFRGEKQERWGGDDEVRPMFPATAEDLHPIGDWMFRLHQELIGIRRRNPWLTTARTETVDLTNRRYAYDVVGEEGQRMRVTLSIEGKPWATIEVDGQEGWQYRS